MKKIISILPVSLVAMSFAACGKKDDSNNDDETAGSEYNVVLYDSAVEWIDNEFQRENRVKGAIFDEQLDGETDDYPKTRTYIVADRGTFESIFAENFTEFEVDFDHEMIIVYSFATEYVLPAKITDVDLTDETLTISYKIELPPDAGCAVRPFQRWFVIKSDKLDISSVIFSMSIMELS